MTKSDAASTGSAHKRTRTVRARVAQGAVQRVTSFYDASIASILGEIYQNARRSSASHVRVDIDPVKMTATVTDDGKGIRNPEAVLSFGRSDWDGTVEDEHPAGMGLYSLSRRGATISSRTATPDGGWRAELRPEHFRGEAPATVEPLGPSGPVGTTVTFPITKKDDAEATAHKQATYMPLNMTVCGTPVSHKRFMKVPPLAGIVEDDDLAFGIQHHKHCPDRNGPTRQDLVINFHGHIVADRNIDAPVVTSLDGWWRAVVEVKRCPELELVLPAREKLIANDYVPTLLERMEDAIYEIIEQSGRPQSLFFTHAQRAKELGHDIETRDDMLVKWACVPADPGWHGYPETTTGRIPPDTLIVDRSLNAAQRTMLDRALLCEKIDLREAGRSTDAATHNRLFAETHGFNGFDWYDRIPRIVDLQVEFEDNSAISKPAPNDTRSRLADKVWIVLSVERSDGAGETAETIRLETDMALNCNRVAEFASGVGLVLSRNLRTDRAGIAHAVSRALFVTSDNCDASWSTQEQEFSDDLDLEMTTLLDGADAGLESAIRNALYGLPEVPAGTNVHLTAEDGRHWDIKTSLGGLPGTQGVTADPTGAHEQASS